MPRTYTIHELSHITGLPARTVKYYAAERLLSPNLPRKGNSENGIYRAFTEVHLAELRRIQEIVDARRSLEDIRDMIHPGEDDE